MPQHHPAQIPWGSGRHSSIPMCPACPQRGAQAPGGTSSRAESEGSSVPAFPRILPLLVLQPLPLCGDKLGKSRAPLTPQLPRALPRGRERTPAAQGEAPGGRAHPEPPAASCARRPAGQGSGGCAPPGRRSPGAVPGRPTFQGAPWPAAGSLGESRVGISMGTQPGGWHGPQPSQGTGMWVLGALGVPPHPHSPAYALALALAARVPWDSGRVFTIRCLVLRASRAAGRVAHCQAAPHSHGAQLSQGVRPDSARRGVPPLPSHPAGCLEQYLLWGWRRCPGHAYHPPT